MRESNGGIYPVYIPSGSPAAVMTILETAVKMWGGILLKASTQSDYLSIKALLIFTPLPVEAILDDAYVF